jgi:hypothetical protein
MVEFEVLHHLSGDRLAFGGIREYKQEGYDLLGACDGIEIEQLLVRGIREPLRLSNAYKNEATGHQQRSSQQPVKFGPAE